MAAPCGAPWPTSTFTSPKFELGRSIRRSANVCVEGSPSCSSVHKRAQTSPGHGPGAQPTDQNVKEALAILAPSQRKRFLAPANASGIPAPSQRNVGSVVTGATNSGAQPTKCRGRVLSPCRRKKASWARLHWGHVRIPPATAAAHPRTLFGDLGHLGHLWHLGHFGHFRHLGPPLGLAWATCGQRLGTSGTYVRWARWAPLALGHVGPRLGALGTLGTWGGLGTLGIAISV